MRRSLVPALLLTSLVFVSPALGQRSLVGAWKFDASSVRPPSDLTGVMNIVFDSAAQLVGGLHIEKKIYPMHGVYKGDRIRLTTDANIFPSISVEGIIDSMTQNIRGVLVASKITGLEKRKQPKEYTNVTYDFYAIRHSAPLKPKVKKKR